MMTEIITSNWTSVVISHEIFDSQFISYVSCSDNIKCWLEEHIQTPYRMCIVAICDDGSPINITGHMQMKRITMPEYCFSEITVSFEFADEFDAIMFRLFV